MSPYYTTPNYAQGHYSVCTDPALHSPLTNPKCIYMSYFTFTVTLEVKVEWSSDLRVERSSDLEAEWNMEQWKCEMGHPLTTMWNKAAKHAATRQVMWPPPHPAKVVAPNTALLSSVFKQYTLLDRLAEAEPQLISMNNAMVINEPVKPVAGPKQMQTQTLWMVN